MLFWTGEELIFRDPAAPISAAEGKNRRATRRHAGPRRGDRSLAEAIRTIEKNASTKFDSDRFNSVDWRRVLTPTVPGVQVQGNAAMPAAEAYFRFSAFRYVFDESKKHSLLNNSELESALLDKNDNGNTINKYYLDNPKFELPDFDICFHAARIAHQKGWLPFVSSDWLIDEGAAGALAMLGLTSQVPKAESSPAGRVGHSAASHLGIAEHVKDVRGRRNERIRLARKCYHRLLNLVEDQPVLGFAGCVDGQRGRFGVTRPADTLGKKQGSLSLSKLLATLDKELAAEDSEVPWEVRHESLVDLLDYGGDLLYEPSLVFRRDLRQLIDRLRARDASPEHGAACLRLAECISTLAFGISWFDVTRAVSGDQFFEAVTGGRIDIDESSRWVSPQNTAPALPLSIAMPAVAPDPRQQDVVVWHRAQIDASGSVVDFRVPDGEEAQRLDAAVAQIWHSR